MAAAPAPQLVAAGRARACYAPCSPMRCGPASPAACWRCAAGRCARRGRRSRWRRSGSSVLDLSLVERGAVVAAAGRCPRGLHHLPGCLRRGGDRRHHQPRAGRRRRLRNRGPAHRARTCRRRRCWARCSPIAPSTTSCRWCSAPSCSVPRSWRRSGARLARAQRARQHVHRAGGAADRRCPHLPRRRAAVVLRSDTGDR